MVGFGFMDNIIMIQAGDLIDSTLGMAPSIGLADLTRHPARVEWPCGLQAGQGWFGAERD